MHEEKVAKKEQTTLEIISIFIFSEKSQRISISLKIIFLLHAIGWKVFKKGKLVEFSYFLFDALTRLETWKLRLSITKQKVAWSLIHSLVSEETSNRMIHLKQKLFNLNNFGKLFSHLSSAFEFFFYGYCYIDTSRSNERWERRCRCEILEFDTQKSVWQ